MSLLPSLLCLLVCGVTGGVGVSITSESVDCSSYASHCADMCLPKCSNKTKKLYIQGFVPANNDEFRSENIVPAAFAAIDEINNDCSYLPGYELVLEFVDTRCDPSEATWQLINSIVLEDQGRNVTKIMFFGGGCSLATEPLAALAGRFYKIPMLSYGASSPALSDNNMFPMFFRTLPSETQANGARIALMKRYNWTRVATLHETEAIFTSSADDFHNKYDEFIKNDNQTGAADDHDRELILRSFTDSPDIPLQQIKQEDIRIIIGYYYENKAVETLCKALKGNIGLHSDRHVWMYIAWYDSNWWMDPENHTMGGCTIRELREAVENAFFFDSYNLATDKNAPTETLSPSLAEFKTKYSCYLEEFRNNPQTSGLYKTSDPHPYYTYTYDAVYTLARALNNTQNELDANNTGLNLDDFKYFDNRTEMIPLLIADYLNKTNFTGVSGQVLFDSKGTRISKNAIYQLRENATSGNLTLELLAIHDPYVSLDDTSQLEENFNFTWMSDPIWKTGGAPPDRSMPIDVYTAPALIYVMDAFIIIALIICLGLLVFNLVTYTKPEVKKYEKCDCEGSNFGYLIGALYVYKGLIVVFGLFLAYESRNVKYMKINDSRFVSIAMYIVVIVIGIGAPLSLVLALHNFVDPAYGLSVTMIITSCLSCLLIIHIPKFVYMANGKDTMVQENMKEEITESSGLQLGTAVDSVTIKTAESEVANLRSKNDERDIELRNLQEGGIQIQIKPRNGSDNDSGVLVTGDETETFSTENDENHNRPSTATPTDVEAPPPGTTL